MKLKNTIRAISKYKGSSKFEFWKDVEIGDRIDISMAFEHPGSGSCGIYSPKIKFRNERTGMEFECKIASAYQYVSQLDYEEC